MSILKHALYCEMGLFRLAGLFRSYKNCITAIAQYTLIIFKLSFRSIFRLLFLFMTSNEDPKYESQKSENLLVLYVFNFLFMI